MAAYFIWVRWIKYYCLGVSPLCDESSAPASARVGGSTSPARRDSREVGN